MSMRRRIIAIIAAALVLVILGISLAAVLQYVRIIEWKDIDGTKYYAKLDDGVYKLYAKGKDKPLKTVDDINYGGYYITALGTLVNLDSETGKVKSFIPVDNIEKTDSVDSATEKVFIFPSVDSNNIYTLEVENEHGGYTFQRVNQEFEPDKTPGGASNGISTRLVLQNAPFLNALTGTEQAQLLSQLLSDVCYPLSLRKLKDPIKGDNGYSEYGLVSEERERVVIDEKTGEPVIDEKTGNVKTEKYQYEPACYTLTEVNGTKRKVIIGDMTVTGQGYYAQYVDISGETEKKKDAVYIMVTTLANTVLAPVEDFVTPVVSHELHSSTYNQVQKFSILNRRDDVGLPNYENMYDKQIAFSYELPRELTGTMAAENPYKFTDLAGYNISATMVGNCIQSIMNPETVCTKKLRPTDEELKDYGFFTEMLDKDGNLVKNENGEVQYTISAKYTISYYYDMPDTDTNEVAYRIYQQIFVSDRDYAETGNYYTYSVVSTVLTDSNGKETTSQIPGYSDFIVELKGTSFEFLEWSTFDWMNPFYASNDISFLTSLTLTSGAASSVGAGYNASFSLSNALTDRLANIRNADKLFINSSHSIDNKKTETLGCLQIFMGIIEWNVTSSVITNNLTKADSRAYYAHNALGNQVTCYKGNLGEDAGRRITKILLNGVELPDTEGATVSVEANTVTINYANGAKKEMVRYGTDVFRDYYAVFLQSNLVGEYTFSTPEEEQAFLADPKNHMLTLKMTFTDVRNADDKIIPAGEETYEYKFYKLSSRKAYITINGNGGFYIYSSNVDKFIADAQRFMAGQMIDTESRV